MTIGLLAFGKWMQHNILWLAAHRLAVGAAGYRFSITERGQDFIDGVRVAPADLRQDLAQVPGGALLAHALHAAHRRTAAGAVARNSGALHLLAPGLQGRHTPRSSPCAKARAWPSRLTNTDVFPDLASEMIAVGEQTGALPQMLNSVAEFFEEDVATALTAALALIEPAILIVMGVVVVFILISLYLPIFSLGQAAGGIGVIHHG